MLKPPLGFELSEVSPFLLQPRLSPRLVLLPRTLPSSAISSLRSENLGADLALVDLALLPFRKTVVSRKPKKCLAQGLVRQEDPFTTKRFYPDSVG